MGRYKRTISEMIEKNCWGECYFDHFKKWLGTEKSSVNIFRYDALSWSIQIFSYDGIFEKCRTFCSFGLSHYTRELGTIGEVVLVANKGWNDIPEILSSMLFSMVTNHIPLDYGIAVAGIKKFNLTFHKKFSKVALYFTQPYAFPVEFETVDCAKTKSLGKMYLAFLISQEEYELFCQYGIEYFEHLFECHKIDPFEIQRPSLPFIVAPKH